MLDVVVVGAGPAGSRAAYSLALQGHSVALLEKRPAVGLKTCCTGIISQECILKFNIPQEVVYRQVSSAKIFSPSGDSLRLARPEVQACVVNRSDFDRYLAGLAQNHGAEYIFNTVVDNIEIRADKVVLSCRSPDRTSTVEAKVAIFACGFNSPLVRKSGLGQSRYFTIGVQTEVKTKELEEIEVYFSHRIAPGFFAWLVPTQNGRALAGLMSQHSAGLHLRNWLADLVGQGKIESGYEKIGFSGIPMYPLARTFKPRLLVIGDAAGQVKPTTGGGIYFGLLCADIAANTLHNIVVDNNYSSKYFEVYDKSWRRLLQSELKREYWARRAYQLLNDRQIDRLFGELKEKGILDSILNGNNLSFDNHGGVIIQALKLGLISRVKHPF